MKLEFGFGTGVQTVEVPDKNLMGVLMSNDVPRELMNEAEVVRALENPIGTPRLKEIVKPGEKTPELFTTVTFGTGLSNEYMEAHVEINVSAEAVQSKNNGTSALTATGWPSEE